MFTHKRMGVHITPWRDLLLCHDYFMGKTKRYFLHIFHFFIFSIFSIFFFIVDDFGFLFCE